MGWEQESYLLFPCLITQSHVLLCHLLRRGLVDVSIGVCVTVAIFMGMGDGADGETGEDARSKSDELRGVAGTLFELDEVAEFLLKIHGNLLPSWKKMYILRDRSRAVSI